MKMRLGVATPEEDKENVWNVGDKIPVNNRKSRRAAAKQARIIDGNATAAGMNRLFDGEAKGTVKK